MNATGTLTVVEPRPLTIDDLARTERGAAARRATVPVVSQDAADNALAMPPRKAGYRRTIDYFTSTT